MRNVGGGGLLLRREMGSGGIPVLGWLACMTESLIDFHGLMSERDYIPMPSMCRVAMIRD